MLQFRWRTATHRLVNHKGKCDSCHVPLNVLRMSLFPDGTKLLFVDINPEGLLLF